VIWVWVIHSDIKAWAGRGRLKVELSYQKDAARGYVIDKGEYTIEREQRSKGKGEAIGNR
jgi:hypothetical protein